VPANARVRRVSCDQVCGGRWDDALQVRLGLVEDQPESAVLSADRTKLPVEEVEAE
jgi:hypothetical protein